MRLGQWLGFLGFPAAALAIMALAASGQGTEESTGGAEGGRVAILAAIEGAIGPATVRHVEKVIEAAEERSDVEAVVLRLNTPGGLAVSMRIISSLILDAGVPVIGYVSPPGAHAASAGTYILYATHLAAMAPGTNIGAATPVQIGGLPGSPSPGEDKPGGDGSAPKDGSDEEASGEDDEAPKGLAPGDAMSAKATNDAVAFIRSLAEMRGRNADWAEKAVREAASLSTSGALEEGVIELVADNVRQLLTEADGRTVNVRGVERTLETRGIAIEERAADTITRLLGVLSNPNVALLLMMIGVYGIIFEFINPGAFAPGVVGAISLTLGLYALNQLPLDYAGLALVLLGAAFMVAEAFTPTFGILGFGGLAAFVTGSAMLVDTDVPAYQVSWWMIGIMAALSGLILIILLGYTIRAYRRPALGGAASLTGIDAEVLEWSGGEGFVWAHGERWSARGLTGLGEGDHVRVRDLDGLTLVVGRSEGGDDDEHKQGDG